MVRTFLHVDRISEYDIMKRKFLTVCKLCSQRQIKFPGHTNRHKENFVVTKKLLFLLLFLSIFESFENIIWKSTNNIVIKQYKT